MSHLKNVIDKQNEAKNQFAKIQAEKSFFLGEYRERVLVALQKDQIEEDDVYEEILEAMGEEEAYLLKMSRELNIKKLKPYIQHAEKLKLKYQLVDGLSYYGNIGLVVVSREALNNPPQEPIIRDMDQDFIDAGLGEIFSKNRGKKICREHYKSLLNKLPEYEKDFEKINIFDTIIGRKCPICETEKKLRRK